MLRAFPFLLHWAARLSTILVAGTYALMVAGEFGSRYSGFPREFREWAGILLLTAACVGMVVAWERELLGAFLSLVALAAFGLLVPIQNHLILLVAATPGTLYILDWLVARTFEGPAAGQGPAAQAH